jgi:uncharacterized protein
MKGPIFEDSKKQKFYYSPFTGRIVPVPREITLDDLVEEPGHFIFKSNPEEVKRRLEEERQSIILEATQECNLRCSYCIYGGDYVGERVHSKKSMSIEVALRASEDFLNHSKKSKFKTISFYGGEPTLNFDVVKKVILAYEGEKGLRFSISTNGTTLEKHARFIQDHRILTAISLDGPKEINDKNRVYNGTNRGSYEGIIKGLNQLNDSFKRKNISFSATIGDSKDFMTCGDFFSSFFPHNAFRVGFVKSWDSPMEQITATKKDFEKLKRRYVQIMARGEKAPTFLSFLFEEGLDLIDNRVRNYGGDELPVSGSCIPGVRKLFVTTEGLYYPCEKLSYPGLEIGNDKEGIDQNKIQKLLNFVEENVNTYCSNCWAGTICNSCIILDSRRGGEYDQERLSKNCEMKRNSIMGYLGIYADLKQIKQLKGGE